jgi:hypothetical protein
MTAVTVDAHRRRRGRRGALQRPRVPRWLSDGLGKDPWLIELTFEILTWVGVRATAGSGLWPLESWAARRVEVSGDWTTGDPATIVREVERVLAAMRVRPEWFARYVDRPLGAKAAPVAATPQAGAADYRPLAMVSSADIDEARLTAVAATGVDSITRALTGGADPSAAVIRVVTTLFGAGTAKEEIDRIPGIEPAVEERISELFGDPAIVARVVAVAQQIVRESGR